jgi:hypothetical protein
MLFHKTVEFHENVVAVLPSPKLEDSTKQNDDPSP